MSNLIKLSCPKNRKNECSEELKKALSENYWVQLTSSKSSQESIPKRFLPAGPGVIIPSGGSTGGPHLCLQPLEHLNQSAYATGQWLKEHGIDPKKSITLNSLPMHHVSGLMPWWRSNTWGSTHVWLKSSLMREPSNLENFSLKFTNNKHLPVLTSLVPNQLRLLIADPAGERWLKSLTLIWIGGARLPNSLAKQAREKEIRLAPCYGATETAAMVSALSPEKFLLGSNSVGSPLKDVEIKTGPKNDLFIKTNRLAIAKWKKGSPIKKITNSNGWWEAGDLAESISKDDSYELQILGRKDNAINSGGETVFLEDLQFKLMDFVAKKDLPVENILLLGIHNAEWGESIVSLVRIQKGYKKELNIIKILKSETKYWASSSKPLAWYICPNLSINTNGKWDRNYWLNWLENEKPISK